MNAQTLIAAFFMGWLGSLFERHILRVWLARMEKASQRRLAAELEDLRAEREDRLPNRPQVISSKFPDVA